MSVISRLGLVAIVAASSLLPVDAGQAGQLRVRELDWDPTTSITSRLRDDDGMVVVRVTGDTIVVGEGSKPKDLVRWGVSKSEMVVVTTLENAHPLLANHDTWIHTSLQGVVQQVLKSRGKVTVSPGRRIELRIGQGEMQIGTVLVRAGSPLPPIKADRKYLLLLRPDDELGILMPTLAPLLIDTDGNTLETMAGDKIPSSGTLAGLTLRDVASIAKRTR